MRISDWSSDVCSSDLSHRVMLKRMSKAEQEQQQRAFGPCAQRSGAVGSNQHQRVDLELLHPKVVDRLAQREEPAEEIGCDIAGRGQPLRCAGNQPFDRIADPQQRAAGKRSEEHTSELQSRMRTSYAVFCLKTQHRYLVIEHRQYDE